MTYSFTTSTTFTRTSAQYLASKVIADLRRMNSYYGKPTSTEILDYYTEVVELLVPGYLANVEYGFNRDRKRIVSLYYEVRTDGSLTDGRSGGVYARADITGASWFSFLEYSPKWLNIPRSVRENFKSRLPIQRTEGQGPQDGNGYWVTDRSYFTDGVGAQRRTFRPY